jgi:HPt (histidine-containing phosphotransfer) domain-containing protein
MDTAVLRQIVGDDEATVREFLAFFRQTAQQQCTEMSTACAMDDTRTMASIAHKLKSSSRSIGAEALANICAAIEASGSSDDMTAMRAHMVAFDTEWRRVEADIGAHLSLA